MTRGLVLGALMLGGALSMAAGVATHARGGTHGGQPLPSAAMVQAAKKAAARSTTW